MAVQSLVTLLARDDCHLVSLCLEDSQLKEHTNLVLDALVENASLAKINLRYVLRRWTLCFDILLCVVYFSMQW